MNHIQRGYYRDRRLIELVERCGALDTEQISLLFFTRPRKARERLLALVSAKRLKRYRASTDQPFAYFVDKRPVQLEHLLATNWAIVWLATQLDPWQRMGWEYEYECGDLRADAFVSIQNTATGRFRFWFVELDRSDNRFDKVQKYNDLYASARYRGQWWVRHTKRFPSILIVTESRLRLALKTVQEQNRHGLEFVVKTLADIRKEVLEWGRRPERPCPGLTGALDLQLRVRDELRALSAPDPRDGRPGENSDNRTGGQHRHPACRVHYCSGG